MKDAAVSWMKWALSPLAVAAQFLATGGSLAQDVFKPSNYGDHVFTEPGQSVVADVYAGGSVDAAELGGACAGWISDAPDVQVDLRSPGRTLDVLAQSTEEADITLVVNTAEGAWLCDDDGGGGLDALVGVSNPPPGVYDIWIGSFEDEGEYSAVTLSISQGGAGDAASGPRSGPESVGGAEWVENGRLDVGDAMADGRYRDEFRIRASAGEALVFDLRSPDFDTYLDLRSPSGALLSNDDYEGATDRSLVAMTADEDGEFAAVVSSFASGDRGNYTLSFFRDNASVADTTAEAGTLDAGDATDEGRYTDVHRFEGAPGRRTVIDLTSDEFDPYLILRAPSGLTFENDDTGESRNSRIDTVLTESGIYEVVATSYDAGETGGYRLSIDLGQPIGAEEQAERDTADVRLGETVSARIETSDLEREARRYEDLYSFSGEAGEAVRVSMSSAEFDTYLAVRSPGGVEFANDDHEGSTERSVVEFILPESGRYQVSATTYGPDMTGGYDLTVERAAAPVDDRPWQGDVEEAAGGTIYGIFAGIADYGELRQVEEGWADLDYTDHDATLIRDALIENAGMDPQNAYMFPNREATRAHIEAAFRDIAARIGPEDRFVFFFSGHGGQEERPGGFDAADADGYDETIALSDQTLTDDELRGLFDMIPAGVAVAILDSCFSGGFAKDIVAAPGRMGLFSSDEDVPSLVAAKFAAGGYLSYFLSEAVTDGHADADGDRWISAMELSQYIRDRYRDESTAKTRSTFSTPSFGYQHLVVDRGGVSHDTPIFAVR